MLAPRAHALFFVKHVTDLQPRLPVIAVNARAAPRPCRAGHKKTFRRETRFAFSVSLTISITIHQTS